MYPQQLDRFGHFAGTAKLHLYAGAPRKCSVLIKHKLKREFDSIVPQTVIRKFDEHTHTGAQVKVSLPRRKDALGVIGPK